MIWEMSRPCAVQQTVRESNNQTQGRVHTTLCCGQNNNIKLNKQNSNLYFQFLLPIVYHKCAAAMGIGSLNIIRDVHNDKYKQSTRTSGGSEKWLDVQLFNDTAECINTAKKLGYRVVVTHLRADAVPINKVDWTQPTAIVFGNELDGASDTALALADEAVYIPIDGFVESYNMSVAAALIFWEVRQARMQALGSHGDLSPEEQHILKAVMFLRSKGVARQCITHLLKRPPPDWQLHRNNGQWFDKEFEEQGVDFSNKRRCDFWDGCQCYGERLLFPGKTCRYQDMHIKGLSTLNKGKLIHRCQSRGIVVPDLDLKRDRKTQPKAVVQEEREVEHVSV